MGDWAGSGGGRGGGGYSAGGNDAVSYTLSKECRKRSFLARRECTCSSPLTSRTRVPAARVMTAAAFRARALTRTVAAEVEEEELVRRGAAAHGLLNLRHAQRVTADQRQLWRDAKMYNIAGMKDAQFGGKRICITWREGKVCAHMPAMMSRLKAPFRTCTIACVLNRKT
jgi:hypothetical protein